MMQQVNLYQPILRKEPKVFSAAALLQSLAAIALALLLIWGFARWQVLGLERELARARVQQVQSMERLEQLRTLYPAKAADGALQRQLGAVQQDIETKRRVLGALAEQRFGNATGFVAQFEGLARQRIEGLWLTRVEFAAGGTVLGLHGKALTPELLPRYLRRLGAEPAFVGTEFQTFVMTRPERAPVEFRLSTRGAAQ